MRKKYTIGGTVLFRDESSVTINQVNTEINYTKVVEGLPETHTISLDEFEKLVKPTNAEPVKGLKFMDEDKSTAEIIEVGTESFIYKKTWGADSWNNEMKIEDFLEKVENNKIAICS